MALSLDGIPVAQIRDLAIHLLQSGNDVDSTITQIVTFLDALVDDAAIVGPVAGPILEEVDGTLLTLLIRMIVHAVAKKIDRVRTANALSGPAFAEPEFGKGAPAPVGKS